MLCTLCRPSCAACEAQLQGAAELCTQQPSLAQHQLWANRNETKNSPALGALVPQQQLVGGQVGGGQEQLAGQQEGGTAQDEHLSN